jgi:hypothetical protein
MCYYFAMQQLSYHNPNPWPVFIQQNYLGPGGIYNKDSAVKVGVASGRSPLSSNSGGGGLSPPSTLENREFIMSQRRFSHLAIL